MQDAAGALSTSVGKKILRAVTGAALVLFVIGHMVGNLKVFFGKENFDHYARGLRTFGDPFLGYGQFLWIARIGLLAALAVHMVMAWQTWRMSRAARPIGYHTTASINFSHASRTMRWGGVAILAFVVYHLLHLTTGTVHPEFSHDSAYANVVAAFRRPAVSVAYVLAMIPLGLHLYHGIWSACQTLDLNGPRISALRRPVAAAIALVVVLGFIAVPLAVLGGLVR